MPTPRRLPLPFYTNNNYQEYWCAPAPIGSDLNDGMDERYPKETFLAAYDASPSDGVHIHVAPGTYVGGEVPGQGVWLMGGNATLPPGWRRHKAHFVEGYGSGPLVGQFSWPQAQLIRGRPGDVTKPTARRDVGLWVDNNGGTPFCWKNIFMLGFSIGGRLGVNGDPAVNPDVPPNRGSLHTVAGFYFDNVTFQNNGGGSDVNEGPGWDLGYILFGQWHQCAVNSYPEIAPLNSDRHASWLSKPSDGTSRLEIYQCKGTHSGVIYYNGASTWGFVIDGYEIESDTEHAVPAVVKLIGLDKSGQGYVNNVLADDTPSSTMIVDNTDSLNFPDQVLVYNAGYALAGPLLQMGSSAAGLNQAVDATPAGKYQSALAAGRLWMDQDAPRFNTPVITNRFYNMVPQRDGTDGLVGNVINPPDIGAPANRVWTSAGATGTGTVNSPIADRRGSNLGIRIATNNGDSAYQRFFLHTQPAAVGDIWIAGAWIRADGLIDGGQTLSLILSNTGVTIEDHGSNIYPPFGGAGEWQFCAGWAKVTGVSGGSPQVNTSFYITAYPGNPVDIDGRFLIKLAAGTYSQNEFGMVLQNLQSFVQAPTGTATTQPGQMLIAQGGLGVGNAVAATTPGSVVKKVQIFDAFGNSIGYIPVYSSIT